MARPKTPKTAVTEDTAEKKLDEATAAEAEAVKETPAPETTTPVVSKEPEKAPETRPDPKPTPPESKPPESKVAKPTHAAPQRRSGFLPLVLGGVVAAGIGAGATIYLLPKIPPQWLPLPQAPQVDEAALRGAIEAQGARVDDLGAELSGLKSAIPAPPDLSGLDASLAEVRQATDGLAAQLSQLETRLTELEKRPVAGGGASATAIQAFEREMEEMRGLLKQSRSASDATQEQIAAAAEQAAARISAAEDEAAKLRQEADAAAKRAMAQAAVARLAAALDSGAPTASALADLQGAGVTVPAELQGETPSLRTLRAAFPEAARAALAVSRKATAGDGAMDKIGAFLLAQTGARSLEPREGNDPDAILSRAEAALAAGDLATVMTEIAALPEEGRAAMADWVAMAEQRLAATNALGTLSQSLN